MNECKPLAAGRTFTVWSPDSLQVRPVGRGRTGGARHVIHTNWGPRFLS